MATNSAQEKDARHDDLRVARSRRPRPRLYADAVGGVVPIVLGVLAWLGLYLREERLRVLIPLRGLWRETAVSAFSASLPAMRISDINPTPRSSRCG